MAGVEQRADTIAAVRDLWAEADDPEQDSIEPLRSALELAVTLIPDWPGNVERQSEHQCEPWQIRLDSGENAYCAACGKLIPKPPEVEVHVTPGAEPNADAGEEGVVHLVCPYDGCRAVDRIAVVEDAGEVELGMNNGAYLVDGDLAVDFATSDEYVDTEWQDKHVCQACQKPVTMPDYYVSYNGAGF